MDIEKLDYHHYLPIFFDGPGPRALSKDKTASEASSATLSTSQVPVATTSRILQQGGLPQATSKGRNRTSRLVTSVCAAKPAVSIDMICVHVYREDAATYSPNYKKEIVVLTI